MGKIKDLTEKFLENSKRLLPKNGKGRKKDFESKIINDSSRTLYSGFVDSVSSIICLHAALGERKSAHGEGHLLSASNAAIEYCMQNPSQYDGVDRKKAARMAAVAGVMHDFVRISPNKAARSNASVSAELLEYFHAKQDGASAECLSAYSRMSESLPQSVASIEKFLMHFESENPGAIEMIAKAIRTHDQPVTKTVRAIDAMAFLGNYEGALLQEALLYADKGVEGMGRSIVLRRAQYDCGQRAEDKADAGIIYLPLLKRYSDVTDQDLRVFVFVAESFVRLYSQKRLEDFPQNWAFAELEASRLEEKNVFNGALSYLMAKYGEKSPISILESIKAAGYPALGGTESGEQLFLSISERMLMDKDAFVLSGTESSFVQDSYNFIVGTAYSQSTFEAWQGVRNKYLGQIKSASLKSLAQESDASFIQKKNFGLMMDVI